MNIPKSRRKKMTSEPGKRHFVSTIAVDRAEHARDDRGRDDQLKLFLRSQETVWSPSRPPATQSSVHTGAGPTSAQAHLGEALEGRDEEHVDGQENDHGGEDERRVDHDPYQRPLRARAGTRLDSDRRAAPRRAPSVGVHEVRDDEHATLDQHHDGDGCAVREVMRVVIEALEHVERRVSVVTAVFRRWTRSGRTS